MAKRKRTTTVFIHLLMWSLYLLSEYVANLPHLNEGEHDKFVFSALLHLPVLMIPTYLTVYLLVPVFLEKRRYIIFGMGILILCLSVLYGRLFWSQLMNWIYYDYSGSMPLSKIWKNVVRDYSVVALAVCIYVIADWRQKADENRRIMEEKAKAELQLLKSQLHPHFLFNTLNNIYSLALEHLPENSDTVKSILKLSQLMEYLVYHSGGEKTEVKKELELIENYLDLEKLRYGDELVISVEMDDFISGKRTVPLVVLPLIENCFKHGGKNEKGYFVLDVSVLEKQGHLEARIANSISSQIGSNDRTGVGLKNLRERLQHAYQNTYSLEVQEETGLFVAHLKIPLN